MNYDPEAMRMTFGEGAEQFKNWGNLMDEFSGSATEARNALNGLDQAMDTDKVGTYEAQIRRAKIELSELASQGFKQGDPVYDDKARELASLVAQQKKYNKALRDEANADVGGSKNVSRLKNIGSALGTATSRVKKFTSSVRSGFKTASNSVSGFISMLGKLGRGLASPIVQLGRLRNAVFGLQQQANKGMNWGRMIRKNVCRLL